MHLNHPETIPLPLVCGKIVHHETSHWHQKRLGTANLSLCHTLNSRSQTHFPGFRLYKLEKIKQFFWIMEQLLRSHSLHFMSKAAKTPVHSGPEGQRDSGGRL